MNTLTQDMSFSAIDERLPAAEQDEIFEVNTCLGKEDIHVVRQGQGTEHFLIWHGFDSVNRFYPLALPAPAGPCNTRWIAWSRPR